MSLTTPTRPLTHQLQIPMLGLGTWQLRGDECASVVKQAMEVEYTHIDTALMYENHREIAQGMSGFDREKVFITSKLAVGELEPSQVAAQAERILRELDTDYLDALLIHWPDSSVDMNRTFEAFSELFKSEKIRSAGVSNFTISHLERYKEWFGPVLCINQVEFHPYLVQSELLAYCEQHDIRVCSYSPIARKDVLEDAAVKEIAERRECTPAQVVLRWHLQHGLIAIPKASSREHLAENLASIEVRLSREDVERIDQLDQAKRMVNPEWGEFAQAAEG